MRHRRRNLSFPVSSTFQNRSSPGSPWVNTVTTSVDGSIKDTKDCCLSKKAYVSTLARGGVLPYQPVIFTNWNCDKQQPHGYYNTRITGAGAPWVNSQGYWYPDHSYFNPFPAIPLDQAAISYVTNAAIASAKDGAWDAGTSLAEAAKTVRGMAHRINRIFDLATSASARAEVLSRGSFQRIQTFNRLWLEGRYAWRPLYYEVNDMAQHLLMPRVLRQEGRASTSVDLSFSTGTKVSAAPSVIYSGTSYRVGTRTYRGFAIADGHIESATIRPLAVGWELTTLSFMVDRFVDIGSAINAWTPIPGVEIRASGYSVRTSWTDTYDLTTASNPGNPNVVNTQVQPYRYEETFEEYYRQPSGAVLPRFFPRLNSSIVLDIVAIASQRYLRILNRLTSTK